MIPPRPVSASVPAIGPARLGPGRIGRPDSVAWTRTRPTAETAKLIASASTPPTARRLGNQPGSGRSRYVGDLLAALQLRVALGQIACVKQRRQERPVGGQEEDRRRPRDQRHHHQLGDGESAERGSNRHAPEDSETRSATIMIRRRGSRSSQAPAGRPTSSHGSQAAAVSIVTANTLACGTLSATSGNATELMLVPKLLVVSRASSGTSSISSAAARARR